MRRLLDTVEHDTMRAYGVLKRPRAPKSYTSPHNVGNDTLQHLAASCGGVTFKSGKPCQTLQVDAAVKKPTAAKSKPKAKAKNLAASLGLSETGQRCKESVVAEPACS